MIRIVTRLAACGAFAVVALAVPLAARADTDPCSLIPTAQAAALSAGSGKGDWHHHTGTNRYAQETCHYPGPANKALMVAVHLSAAPFANVKMMTKALPGVGDDATFMQGPAVIAFVKHGTYVTMSWAGDTGKPAPSPQFVAAAKAAAAKL
ncbi:MAG TPA: hypothetical protein VHT53_12600 [Candidatus Elarobacter sp.]|jgi:hypothetical protein|nr:hypothetical protein [Candidatus Elarobacter sp.]